MQINNECSFLGPEQIKIVEEKYSATYVAELPVKTVGGEWANFPCAIFYTQEAHPQGSNYMALYRQPLDGKLYVANGISAVEGTFNGAVAEDGEVIYSRYRHDCRTSKDGTVMIDGGRDYLRASASKIVQMKVVKDRIEMENENAVPQN